MLLPSVLFSSKTILPLLPGLLGLSEDCLELMSQATEFLLKNAIHNYVLTTRGFKTSGNFNYCGITEAEYATDTTSSRDASETPIASAPPRGATASPATATTAAAAATAAATAAAAAVKDQQKPEVPTMTLNDMHFSLQLSPYLLGENATQMEKILVHLRQKNGGDLGKTI